MWDVPGDLIKDVELPSGFYLKEDDHLLYLFYRGDLFSKGGMVAVFSAEAKPEEIKLAAEEYLCR